MGTWVLSIAGKSDIVAMRLFQALPVSSQQNCRAAAAWTGFLPMFWVKPETASPPGSSVVNVPESLYVNSCCQLPLPSDQTVHTPVSNSALTFQKEAWASEGVLVASAGWAWSDR